VQSLSKLAVAIAGWDTMSLSTKMAFVDGLKRVANMDAPGYPIKFGKGAATGTVIGHASEGWVFTGQLPAGLAMHDIDPSMYEGAARFFFEGLLPVRQLAYKAHKHYQGSHYSYARYEHEIASAMIWNAISANVFPPSQPAVMSEYVYSLLPNGTSVTYGDCEASPRQTLDGEVGVSITMASALYTGLAPPDGETFLPEHLRWIIDHPPQSQSSEHHGKPCSPAKHAAGKCTWSNWGKEYWSGLVAVINFIHIMSDTPDSTDIATLPTVRYFPDPMGEMIVRTGWDLTASSTDTVIALRIGGIFFGNHQRRDAGSFQVFSRGPLAMSSGHYSTYGDAHWQNYYHPSISTNTLLILDPNEGSCGNIKGNEGKLFSNVLMPCVGTSSPPPCVRCERRWATASNPKQPDEPRILAGAGEQVQSGTGGGTWSGGSGRRGCAEVALVVG
jgi:heparin/heparan-sulfate lyase